MSSADKIFDKAKKSAKDRRRLTSIVNKTSQKLQDFASNSAEWQELKSKVNVLVSMLQHHLKGEYKSFSTSTVILIVFALLYFITPIDAIPDFIPVLGLTDDASILILVYRKINKDIEAFIEWSNSNQ